MTAALERLRVWLDESLNPILVKDLRQAVRGRFFTGILLLFLFLQMMLLFVVLGDEVRSGSMQMGWEVFSGLLQLLIITTMGLMPLIMGYRLYQDFQPGEQDLFTITTLTPRQIINGKLLGAWLLTAMFYALHMPLATLTVFLRGVDFPSILVILFSGLIFTGFIHLATVLAVLGPARQQSIAGVFFGGSWLLYFLVMMFQEFIQQVHRHGMSGGFWGFLSRYWEPLLVLVFVAGVAYEWSVAKVTPLHANRSLGVRRFISCFFLGSLSLVSLQALSTGKVQPIEFWVIFLGVILMFCFAWAAADRLEPGRRILAEILTSRVGRGAFIFSTGVAGGLAWASTLGILLLLVVYGYPFFHPAWMPEFSRELNQAWAGLQAGILFGFNIGMTGFLLRRISIALGLADDYAVHFSVGLFILTGLVPFFILAVFQDLGRTPEIPSIFFISPLLIGEKRYQASVIIVQMIWAALNAILNISWIYEKWAAFVPPALPVATLVRPVSTQVLIPIPVPVAVKEKVD